MYVISENGSQNQGHVDGGHLMSACKEACRRAFNSRHPRLVTPMYSCNVLVNSDVLGKWNESYFHIASLILLLLLSFSHSSS